MAAPDIEEILSTAARCRLPSIAQGNSKWEPFSYRGDESVVKKLASFAMDEYEMRKLLHTNGRDDIIAACIDAMRRAEERMGWNPWESLA